MDHFVLEKLNNLVQLALSIVIVFFCNGLIGPILSVPCIFQDQMEQNVDFFEELKSPQIYLRLGPEKNLGKPRIGPLKNRIWPVNPGLNKGFFKDQIVNIFIFFCNLFFVAIFERFLMDQSQDFQEFPRISRTNWTQTWIFLKSKRVL